MAGAAGRPNKYGARRVECGDHVHASRHERDRCWINTQREARGEIRERRRHTRWPLQVNGVLIGHYTDDEDYEERQADGSWAFVVEDAKGYPSRDYRLRKLLMLACYGHRIRET